MKQISQFAQCPARRNCLPRRAARGFTLIELMIVITIILILVGMAAVKYDRAVLRAREAMLKQDLYDLRKAIDNYTLDKQQAPQSLEDLKGQYLHDIPPDPITRAKDWVPHYGDTLISPDQVGTGIDDVHSSSDQLSSDGTPYSTW